MGTSGATRVNTLRSSPFCALLSILLFLRCVMLQVRFYRVNPSFAFFRAVLPLARLRKVSLQGLV